MYVLLEYLTYLVMTMVLALVLFVATTLCLATRAGARLLLHGSRRLATHAYSRVISRIRTSTIRPPATTHQGQETS